MEVSSCCLLFDKLRQISAYKKISLYLQDSCAFRSSTTNNLTISISALLTYVQLGFFVFNSKFLKKFTYEFGNFAILTVIVAKEDSGVTARKGVRI